MKDIYLILTVLCVLVIQVSSNALADSRLLATGGVSPIEGGGGGGINPWAVISGYDSTNEISFTPFYTHADIDDYSLNVVGAAFSVNNRFELSFARQDLELETLGDLIGQPHADLEQDIIGLKVRLFGDVIYTSLPQVSLGVQYKHNRKFDIPETVGAQHDEGIDIYLSAAKLWLAGIANRNIFINTTIRSTRANQVGLLGFGGDESDHHELVFEGTAAVFLNRRTAIGYEYREKPDNLSFAKENDWHDIFFAYFPNKHVSIVAAYVDLGSIATLQKQNGWYASLEASF